MTHSVCTQRFAAMSADIEKILQSLTLEEKISILAGKDFWETVPVKDKGVPAIKVRLLSTHSNLTAKSI